MGVWKISILYESIVFVELSSGQYEGCMIQLHMEFEGC